MINNLRIESLSLDGHEISVPVGLAEIINRSSAWMGEKEPKEDSPLNEYDREVVLKDGRLFTYLTKKVRP